MQKYIAGFRLLSVLEADGLITKEAAAVEIAKGDALFDDGSGYVTNVGTAFAATFQGFAAAAVDNSGGSDGDLNVVIIPPRDQYKFMAPNGSATVAAQTDIGERVDLESNASLDVTDNTIVGFGFLVEEIDISTEALAANAGGYLIGSIVTTAS